jgi:hypothetical protein
VKEQQAANMTHADDVHSGCFVIFPTQVLVRMLLLEKPFFIEKLLGNFLITLYPLHKSSYLVTMLLELSLITFSK